MAKLIWIDGVPYRKRRGELPRGVDVRVETIEWVTDAQS